MEDTPSTISRAGWAELSMVDRTPAMSEDTPAGKKMRVGEG